MDPTIRFCGGEPTLCMRRRGVSWTDCAQRHNRLDMMSRSGRRLHMTRAIDARMDTPKAFYRQLAALNRLPAVSSECQAETPQCGSLAGLAVCALRIPGNWPVFVERSGIRHRSFARRFCTSMKFSPGHGAADCGHRSIQNRVARQRLGIDRQLGVCPLNISPVVPDFEECGKTTGLAIRSVHEAELSRTTSILAEGGT